MKEQDKQLLLTDLCGRLHYGVKANIPLIEGDKRIYIISFSEMDDFKKGYITIIPYLRQMSSMTEEEINEYKHFVAFSGNPIGSANFIDWLNKKMLDYRGLIEKGLAIKVTEENNPYK